MGAAKWRAAATALFGVALLAAAPVAFARSETLIVAVSSDIITLDPARFTGHFLTEVVQRLVYGTLLERNGSTVSGGIAASIKARDPFTWELDIVQGATSHSGAPLTPEAIAQHFNRLTSAAGIGGYPAPARERLGPVQEAAADGGKLVIRLAQPWASLPARLMAEPVAALDSRGQTVGTGPFHLERWDRGNRVVLARVGEAPHPDMVQRIQFEVIPSAEERLRRVLSGEVHIALELPPGAYWRLRASRLAKPVVVPQSRVHFIEFDHSRPPFNDRRVRQALNLAVDTRALLRQVAQGEAEAVPTLLSPVTLGYDPALGGYPYDPARARQLLAEAGYPEGFSFELDVPRVKERVARLYQAMLREVGVDVHLRLWDTWQSLREQIRLGRRQAWMAEWGNSSLDPGTAIRPKLHSAGEANYGGYSNPVLDAMLDETDALLDPAERLKRYRAIQAYILEEAPVLFGYVEYDVYGASVDLDWRPGPGRWLELDKARWIR